MMIKPEELRKMTEEALHKQATKSHVEIIESASASRKYIEDWSKTFLAAIPTLLKNAASEGKTSVLVFDWVLDSDRYGRAMENAVIGSRLIAALTKDEHAVEYVDNVVQTDALEKENHRSIVVSW